MHLTKEHQRCHALAKRIRAAPRTSAQSLIATHSHAARPCSLLALIRITILFALPSGRPPVIL
eukprot:1032058-Pleurochrysis_carterae.AAC.1